MSRLPQPCGSWITLAGFQFDGLSAEEDQVDIGSFPFRTDGDDPPFFADPG